MEKKLTALRGATRCENSVEDIKKQVSETYEELLARNNMEEKDIVSVFFTVTQDLDAKTPATALRETGRAVETALIVSQEASFPGSLQHVIRLLIHCHLEGKPVHIYRNGAELLRPDIASV